MATLLCSVLGVFRTGGNDTEELSLTLQEDSSGTKLFFLVRKKDFECNRDLEILKGISPRRGINLVLSSF
jgi:hypothetical protein